MGGGAHRRVLVIGYSHPLTCCTQFHRPFGEGGGGGDQLHVAAEPSSERSNLQYKDTNVIAISSTHLLDRLHTCTVAALYQLGHIVCQ